MEEGRTSKRQTRRAIETHVALLALVMAAMLFVTQPFGGHPSANAQTSGDTRKIIFVGGITGHSDCSKGDTDSYVSDWKDVRAAAAAGLLAENISLNEDDVIGFSYSDNDCPSSPTSQNFGTVPQYSSQDTCNGIDLAADRLDSLISKLVQADAGVKIDIFGHSMGGAVIASWVAAQPADSANIKAIHAVTTIDSPLQGVSDIRGTLAQFAENFQGCPEDANTSVSDLLSSSSLVDSIRNPKNTTAKVPFVTLRNKNDLVVPYNIASIDGAWTDAGVDCGALQLDPIAHGCPLHDDATKAAIKYAVSHDVVDERLGGPVLQRTPANSWSAYQNANLLGDMALESNVLGDSVSTSFSGPSLAVVYGRPVGLGDLLARQPTAEVSIDSGSRVELLEGQLCVFRPGSIGPGGCRKEFDGLGDGEHTVTLTVKSSGTKGGFIFDYFETETAHSSAPIECPPGANVDVALIIDSSGSMGSSDPASQRLAAAEAFVNNAANADRLGIISFSDRPSVVQPMIAVSDDRSSIIDAIAGIGADGGTDIGGGLQAAHDMLAAVTSGNKKAAVLLTDGLQTTNSYNDQHALFASDGWPVYVIGLGSDVDPAFLNAIASATGTKQYIQLDDPNQLVNVYFTIATQQKCGIDQKNETKHLAQGETQTVTVDIPTGQLSASFLVSWPGSAVDLTLVDPGGVAIGPNTTDASIAHAKGLTYELYRVENPAPGPWIMQIYGRDLAAGGEDVTIQSSSIPNPSAETPAPALPAPSPASSDGFDYALAAAATAVVGLLVLASGGLWVFNANQGPLGMLTLSSPSAAATPFSIGRRTRAVTIGRSRASDIFVDDPYASRNHARVYRDGESLVIEDLNSTGGTTLNGEPITAAPLQNGDVIGIGESRLIFRKGRERPRA